MVKRGASEPKLVTDLRRIFDDKDIDAVSIATPNHWHALADDLGLPGGQGRLRREAGQPQRLRRAADGRGRPQVRPGRPDGHADAGATRAIEDAIEFLRSGKLGKVYMAKGLCYKPRGSIGHKADAPVPPGVDYNLWLGPAPERPFNPNRFHYNWHWFWDYGNGDLGNQGIHQMDIARWGLGKSELAQVRAGVGGRFGYDDDGETPNTELVAFEFDDCQLQFEVRGLPTNDEAGVRVGNLFYGTEGVLAITSYTSWHTLLGPKLEKGPGGKGGGDHFANFVQAVKSRDAKSLNADIEEGHLSSAYCHLGNIAYRLGRKLQIDPSTESFVNDSEADTHLTREYRDPFVVPTQV